MDEKIEIGAVDIPSNYIKLTEKEKNLIADKMIVNVLKLIEYQLRPLPHINRITFLEQVLESSIQSNVEDEMYEVAAIFMRCKQRLNNV